MHRRSLERFPFDSVLLPYNYVQMQDPRYEADIDLAVHWVLGRPEAFLLTTGDVEILPRLLDAAERFERRPSDEDMAALADRREVTPLFV
jgi:hypothetical protein